MRGLKLLLGSDACLHLYIARNSSLFLSLDSIGQAGSVMGYADLPVLNPMKQRKVYPSSFEFVFEHLSFMAIDVIDADETPLGLEDQSGMRADRHEKTRGTQPSGNSPAFGKQQMVSFY